MNIVPRKYFVPPSNYFPFSRNALRFQIFSYSNSSPRARDGKILPSTILPTPPPFVEESTPDLSGSASGGEIARVASAELAENWEGIESSEVEISSRDRTAWRRCSDFCGTGDRQKPSSLIRHDAFGLRDSVTSSIGNSRREKWQEDPEERRRRKPS